MTLMSTLAYTRHATLLLCSLALAHTHVTLRYGYLGVGLGGVVWGNDVHVNLHTHVMLHYCYVLLHLHTHVLFFSCPLWQGRKSLTDGGKA